MRTTKARRRVVGVRDAKARLSELLRDAQLGHEWTITERGRPIARLVPIAEQPASLDERLARLVRAGVLEDATAVDPSPSIPVAIPLGLARRMLDDDRNA